MYEVSVIVPTFHRYRELGQLLHALQAQTVPPHEVIVADQTPLVDRPAGFYDAFEGSELQVVDLDEPSLSKPRNVAARLAKGDLLIFVDDDIVVREDFIEAHLRVLQREQVDVVNGAVTRRPELPSVYPWDVSVMDPVRFFLAAPNYRWSGMMLSISSCNVCIKRTVFMECGGFDEAAPRMVDFELGYRLYRSGAKIYFSDEPSAIHLRAPGGSRHVRGRHDKLAAALYMHRKHFPGWITKQYVLKYLLGRSEWIPNPVRAYRLIRSWRHVSRLLQRDN